jgi:uncharacterized membrane protein
MPSSSDHKRLKLGLAAVSVLVVAYSLLIAQQILLGLLIITAIWGVYLFYRFVQVLARIASALERLVVQRTDGGLAGEFVDEYRSSEPDARRGPNNDA